MGKRYCTYLLICFFFSESEQECQISFVTYHEYKLAVSKFVALLFDVQIRRTLM